MRRRTPAVSGSKWRAARSSSVGRSVPIWRNRQRRTPSGPRRVSPMLKTGLWSRPYPDPCCMASELVYSLFLRSLPWRRWTQSETGAVPLSQAWRQRGLLWALYCRLARLGRVAGWDQKKMPAKERQNDEKTSHTSCYTRSGFGVYRKPAAYSLLLAVVEVMAVGTVAASPPSTWG